MISIETIFLLIPVIAISALSPGPDVLYVLSTASGPTLKSGFIGAAGISTGLLIHTISATFGLSELIYHVPETYTIMKWMGSGYLLYLAIRTACADTSPLNTRNQKTVSYKKIYWGGFLTSALNPKALLFFAAVLPQFLNRAHDDIQKQLLTLSCIAIVVAYISHAGIAVAVQRASQKIRFQPSLRTLTRQKYVLAALFGILALKLATSSF